MLIGFVGRQLPLALDQQLGIASPAASQQLLPAWITEEDHLAQLGALVANVGDHCAVVDGLELGRAHQHGDAGLLEHVAQLVGAVCRG
jgi:hypothetical protein